MNCLCSLKLAEENRFQVHSPSELRGAALHLNIYYTTVLGIFQIIQDIPLFFNYGILGVSKERRNARNLLHSTFSVYFNKTCNSQKKKKNGFKSILIL